MSDSFVTPWTAACQAPLSMGFPRQEYWSGFSASFSRGSSQPKDRTHVSWIGRQILYPWATWEAPVSSLKVNWNEERSSKVLSSVGKNVYSWVLPPRKETWMHTVYLRSSDKKPEEGWRGIARVRKGKWKKSKRWTIELATLVRNCRSISRWIFWRTTLNVILKNYTENVSEVSLWKTMWRFFQQLTFPFNWELP